MKVNGVIYLCLFLLLTACSDQPEPFSERERIAVRFSLSGIQAEVSTRADGDGTSPLAEGTTLRILAFKRVGTNVDLSEDEYIGEGTYKANSGGLLTAVNSLLLPQGTYDFYALTPSLTVNRASKPYTVSVNHGVDYAGSLTTAIINSNNSTVQLSALVRRCAKLTFNFSPKDGSGITSADITAVGLTNMTTAPLTGSLSGELLLTGVGQNATINLGKPTIPNTSKPLEQSISTIILPRSAGACNLTLSVKYNNLGKVRNLFTSLPKNLVFAPGFHYTFTVKMKGNLIEVASTVESWVDNPFTTDMGG